MPSLTSATAYFLIMMGILCFVYLICSIRTNLIFFLIFFTLVPAFGLLAGSYLQLANGEAALAVKLAEAAGAFCFVTCLCGWYIFLAIMLASVDFPLDLPRKFAAFVLGVRSDANRVQLWIFLVLSRALARSARLTTLSKRGFVTGLLAWGRLEEWEWHTSCLHIIRGVVASQELGNR